MNHAAPLARDSSQDLSDWPIGGGETGRLVRRFDWSRTSLGPVSSWAQNLRIKVNSMVNSPIPRS